MKKDNQKPIFYSLIDKFNGINPLNLTATIILVPIFMFSIVNNSLPVILLDGVALFMNFTSLISQKINYNNYKRNKNNLVGYSETIEDIKKNLIEEDKMIDKHEYVVTNKHNESMNVSVEDLINMATIEELNTFRDYLLMSQYLRDIEYCDQLDEDFCVSFGQGKKRKLYLKFDNKKHE